MVCREQLIEDIVNTVFEKFRNKGANRVKQFLQGKPCSTFKKELRRCAEEIVPNYNRMIYSLSAEIFGVLFRPVVRNVFIEEKRKGVIRDIRELMENVFIVLLPLHFSNLDAFILGYSAYRRGLRIPAFAAGKNLLKGAASKFLLPRYNASIIDRDLIQRDAVYATLYLSYVDEVVKKKIPFLYFMQGGRTYTGEIGYNLQTGIFKELLRVKRKNPDTKIALVKISTSYSFVPEASALCNARASGKTARHANLVAEWFRAVSTFRGNLPIYVVVHEPKMLDDYLNENGNLNDLQLAKKIVDELGAAMKVLPIPLYAYARVSGRALEDVRDELEERGANLLEELRSENTKNLSLIVRKYSREIEKVLVNDNLTRYYANTIKHLFDG